jgi:Uma2 family endonuclease
MTGGTRAPATIQRNLAVSLTDRLRGKPGNFLRSDLKIEAAGRIRYPDGFVVCSPGPNTSTFVTVPIVVFEILGPSTSSIDRIAILEEYRATPSIQRYVILEQDRIAATVFARAGGDWIGHFFLDAAILAMPEIGIDVPLAEFYDGLVFDEPDEANDGAPRGRQRIRPPSGAPYAQNRFRRAEPRRLTHGGVPAGKVGCQNSSPKTHCQCGIQSRH